MSVIVEMPASWTSAQLADAHTALDESIELWKAPLSACGVRVLVGEDSQGAVMFRMGEQVSDELGRRIVAAARWMTTRRPAVDANGPNSQG